MGVMRDMEIVWDDLLEAFANPGSQVYFLDKFTGEVFFVPDDYENDTFWNEVEARTDQFLPIPGLDYDQERLFIGKFIKGVTNVRLREMLEKSFNGKQHGRLDEILSFYPEEMERLLSLKEELLAERIRQWLEEHDIFPSLEDF